MHGRWQFAAAVAAATLACAAPAVAAPIFKSGADLSPPGEHGFEPQVAVARSGAVHSVWSRSDGSGFRIAYSTRSATGEWSAPADLSASGQDASEPRLAVDPSGNVLVLWTRSDGSNLRVQAAYRPAGGSFGAPVDVSGAGLDAGEPQIDFDEAGRALAVWTRADGTEPDVCCRRVQAAIRTAGAGGTFGSPVTLSDPGQDASDPQVDVGADVDANAVVVWTRPDGSHVRAQTARRQDYVSYPRPAAAAEVRVALTPAYEECRSGQANRVHGPPLEHPSCNPPVQSSAALTVSTAGANGYESKSSSSLRLRVIPGDPATPVNDADVRVIARIDDVRNRDASATDYTGRLGVRAALQITDQRNSAEQPESGTTTPTSLAFSVLCVSTAAVSAGATCETTTSMNALLPGAVLEGKRAVWGLGQVVVRDAGANGTGYGVCPPTCGDGDEQDFMRQGIFVP